MRELPPTLISDHIELGQCGGAPSQWRDQVLARLKPFERLNRLGWNDWTRMMEPLDEGRARNLVQGLFKRLVSLLAPRPKGTASEWSFWRLEDGPPDGQPAVRHRSPAALRQKLIRGDAVN
jgi:hypothetical protein